MWRSERAGPLKLRREDCLVRAVLRDMHRTLEGQLKTEVTDRNAGLRANENRPPEGSAFGRRDDSWQHTRPGALDTVPSEWFLMPSLRS